MNVSKEDTLKNLVATLTEWPTFIDSNPGNWGWSWRYAVDGNLMYAMSNQEISELTSISEKEWLAARSETGITDSNGDVWVLDTDGETTPDGPMRVPGQDEVRRAMSAQYGGRGGSKTVANLLSLKDVDELADNIIDDGLDALVDTLTEEVTRFGPVRVGDYLLGGIGSYAGSKSLSVGYAVEDSKERPDGSHSVKVNLNNPKVSAIVRPVDTAQILINEMRALMIRWENLTREDS